MSHEALDTSNSAEPANETGLEIAIVGMSLRFPGARNLDEFWWNLRNGVEAIASFTEEELSSSGIDPELLKNPSYVKAKGMIEDIDLFDAPFFGFNPREAEILDPQHRFFLECAWECLEAAGYDSRTYQGLIGVFAGVSLSSYLLNLYSNEEILNSMGPYQLALGNDKDYLATRVSYKLGLDGPSLSVQTSCSTSLVAVHLACRSLLSGDCDMALVGGVSITLPQKSGYWYQPEGISSPDGHCRAFDAKAQGTVGGNGVGVVLVKRLSDALQDRDTIHAIIKGSAINNDGALKAGFTAPSVEGQAQVIRTAQLIAGVEAETISYIEAHGTGTVLGDPIEIAALTKAFRDSTQKRGFCGVGSVKASIGHLDAAAGVAGLIKTTLALKNKQLPPSLHFEQPNPKIDLENSPFYINSQLKEWQRGKTPRRAGVSSFGIGGTNAHVILEEAPTAAPAGESRPKQLLLLSAKTATALDAATASLSNHLKNNPQIDLADVAYTLQLGRRAFSYRQAVVCENTLEAITALETMNPRRVHTGFAESEDRPVAFMFAGQGTQYANMGRQLYDNEPVFREQVDLCSALLESHLKLDIRDVLYPDAEDEEEAALTLKQTHITQPALFVVSYALAKLWMGWGVHPRAMIGHSIGEYVAACLAGVFSLNDALGLVAARGRLMQELPGGAMLSVSLGERQLRPLLGKQLSLASVNAPALCAVSGPTEAIEALKSNLTQYGITSQLLQTSHAFHSELMTPILGPFIEVVRKVKLNAPAIPYISNVTGDWISEGEATSPEYWANHLRQPVRFADGVNELLKEPSLVLLEVGAGRTLATLAGQSPERTSERPIFYSLPRADERRDDEAHLLTTLGRLWLTGAKVNWPGFYTNEERRRIPLPTYPFERRRYWVERQKQKEFARAKQRELHKNADMIDWFYVPSWKKSAPLALFETRDFISEKHCWLIFGEGRGFGREIESRLRQRGHEVITAVEGERFERIEENIFTINPRERSDYDLLIGELLALGKMPQDIVHLWSVTPNGEREPTIELFYKLQYKGFYSLLFLAQAIGKHGPTGPLQIWALSTNLQSLAGEQKLHPEKSTLLAPCKVIPQEYPGISCRTIDVILPKAGTWQESKLVEQLLSEFTAKLSDPVVAYRGEDRWVQTFDAVQLRARAEGAMPLRERGVYLITGGLGGIGLVFAEYLARTARAKLVLINRSAFPKKQDWEHWVATHDEDDRASRRIRRLQAIEALGSEVLTLSGDVASSAQMHSAIDQTYKRFGGLDGVIHAAGVEKEKTVKAIQELNLDECELQFRPKVHGLYALEEALRGRQLDFCLLMSSLSSILGGLGFAGYSAGNVFMDAFARNQSLTNPTPWTSVIWDGWRLDERTREGAFVGSSLTDFNITSEEGVEALHRILGMGRTSQVIVSTGDLHARVNQWINPESLSQAAGPSRHDEVSLHPRPDLRSAYVAPRNELERAIADIWGQMLGVNEIGIHDSFFELGGHSLLATQVISRLRETLQVDVLLRSIFERPSIAELAEEVEDAMLNEIEVITEEQAQRLLEEHS